MGLRGKLADPLHRLAGVDGQIKVQLLELGLQVQIEEKAPDIDQRAQFGGEPLVLELLIARHDGDGDRSATGECRQLRMHRRPTA